MNALNQSTKMLNKATFVIGLAIVCMVSGEDYCSVCANHVACENTKVSA